MAWPEGCGESTAREFSSPAELAVSRIHPTGRTPLAGGRQDCLKPARGHDEATDWLDAEKSCKMLRAGRFGRKGGSEEEESLEVSEEEVVEWQESEVDKEKESFGTDTPSAQDGKTADSEVAKSDVVR